jgi:hypothetical protein
MDKSVDFLAMAQKKGLKTKKIITEGKKSKMLCHVFTINMVYLSHENNTLVL